MNETMVSCKQASKRESGTKSDPATRLIRNLSNQHHLLKLLRGVPDRLPFTTILTGQPEPLPEVAVPEPVEGSKRRRRKMDAQTRALRQAQRPLLGKFLSTVVGTINVNYLLLPVIFIQMAAHAHKELEE